MIGILNYWYIIWYNICHMFYASLSGLWLLTRYPLLGIILGLISFYFIKNNNNNEWFSRVTCEYKESRPSSGTRWLGVKDLVLRTIKFSFGQNVVVRCFMGTWRPLLVYVFLMILGHSSKDYR